MAKCPNCKNNTFSMRQVIFSYKKPFLCSSCQSIVEVDIEKSFKLNLLISVITATVGTLVGFSNDYQFSLLIFSVWLFIAIYSWARFTKLKLHEK